MCMACWDGSIPLIRKHAEDVGSLQETQRSGHRQPKTESERPSVGFIHKQQIRLQLHRKAEGISLAGI